MEQLEYLIRTLTYHRSKLELEMEAIVGFNPKRQRLSGEIDGLSYAITEIYKLAVENGTKE